MAIDNKKEQERDKLHCDIWVIADKLRGAVDGILGNMFLLQYSIVIFLKI